jgi:hypothetical protein
MHAMELSEDYAIVMQRIKEDGEEDFNNLVESLSFERSRLAHIVEALQHKGLVLLEGDGQRGFWLRLSAKGQRLMNYLRPEPGLHPSY